MFSLFQRKLAVVAASSSFGATLAVIVWSAWHRPSVDPVWALKCEQLDAVRAPAESRRKQVLAELSNPSLPAWCGSYAWSNGYERHYLDLAPCGFFYEYSHCTGTGDLAYGEISGVEGQNVQLKVQDRVTLGLDQSWEGRRRRFQFQPELYVIPWGEEQFAIPADLMQEFCGLATATGFNSMTYATYPRKWRDGERGIHDLELHGQPQIPPSFQGALAR